MRVLLVGHPVGHSLSPLIQNAAFTAAGLAHTYEAIDTRADDLAGRLLTLRDGRHLGANVTIPYKVAAVSVMDAVDAEASAIGALNTVVARDGRLTGHNTDVEGAWQGLLQPVKTQLRGATVLLLGAGGGARAVLMALARADGPPADVVIAARSSDSAACAASLGNTLGLRCRSVGWWEVGEVMRLAGALVNCTPLGLGDEDPVEGIPLTGRVVLDLAYRRGGTALFRRAWEEGAMALQGDQMLLHQGAAAFELWTGEKAPLEVMRAALTEALG